MKHPGSIINESYPAVVLFCVHLEYGHRAYFNANIFQREIVESPKTTPYCFFRFFKIEELKLE